MKKVSNLKKIGVKSIHYNDNTVLVEDSFSKQTSLVATLKYENVQNLLSCQGIEYNNEKSHILVNDLSNKSGFMLYRPLKKGSLKSRVNRVKTLSYVQKRFDITNDNNIEIQIYHNFEDIKKIITTYFNNVIYTINSLYKDVSGDDSFVFDKIGSLKVDKDWANFLPDNPNLKQKWEQEYLPNFQKVLNRFGLKTEKTLQVNYIKCLQYVAQKNGYKTQFEVKISEKLQQKLDNLIKDKQKNEHLLKLAHTPTNEFCKDANKIVLYKYFFKNKRIEKIVLAELEKDEILKSLIEKIDESVIVYNYLRLFGAIRQYVVHNNQKIRIENNIHINDNPKRDVADFTNRFAKNNHKYFCILKDLYNDEEVFNTFYEYIIFEDAKSLCISIQNIKKEISKIVDITQDVSKDNLSEYQNKFKTLVCFEITQYLKEHQSLLVEIQVGLKESDSDADKQKIYEKCSQIFVKEFNGFENLRNSIKKFVGNTPKGQEFSFYPKSYLNNQSIFFNAIYVMSKFLTQKESSIMFSKLLAKYNSIKSLLEIAGLVDLKINQDILKGHKTLFALDVKDKNQENYTILQEYNVNKIIQQLKILKSIRSKDVAIKDSFMNELSRIFDLFKCKDIGFDEFKNSLNLDEDQEQSMAKFKLKPLKSYFRNEVYLSKQYQFISNFSSTKLCRQIMSNKNLIRFVIANMLDKDNQECLQMQNYIAKIYHDFKCEFVDIKSSEYLLNQEQIDELVECLYNFTLDDVVDTIFKKTNKNYKVIVRLYITVCYLIIKNIVSQNSNYIIQIQDYENLYNKINNIYEIEAKDRSIKYDLSVVNDFLEKSPNKTSRSYKQLVGLLQKDYIKNYVSKSEYANLLNVYRNMVVHMSLFNDLYEVGFDFGSIENIKSYFGLYQTLVQWIIKETAIKVWGQDYYNQNFQKDNDKRYSTKLCIALNIPFAYNMSRFNNNTIEKYAVKKLK